MTSHALQSYLACSRHKFSLFLSRLGIFGKDKTKLVVCKNVLATTLSTKKITGYSVLSLEKDSCT